MKLQTAENCGLRTMNEISLVCYGASDINLWAYARKHGNHISTRKRLAIRAVYHRAVYADGIIPIHKINKSIFGKSLFLLGCFAMTDELKQRLQDELHKLETELRTEIPQELKKAVALGDLSENAEYDAARNRQDIVRARIANLRQRMSDLSMVDLTRLPKDRVAYGSTVELYDVDSGDDVTYKLVMAEDADISKNKISTTSPIGKGLMGGREGDEVEITTPSGKRRFEIVKLITVHDELPS
jgi:transcription elongation factor GreA